MTKWTLLEEDRLQKLSVLVMKARLQELQTSRMPLYHFPKEGPLTSVLYNVLFLEQTEANSVGLSVNHLFRCIIAHAVSKGLVGSLVCMGTERELVSQYGR